MPTKTEICYDDEKHRYTIGDKELPSITTILKKLGLTKSYDNVDPFYAERGTLVHRCIEMDLDGTLDEASVDPILEPFLGAFRAFKREKGFKCLAWEEIVYSEALGYAGRIDYYGMMEGQLWMIDAKCTKRHDPASIFQLDGQIYAWLDPVQRSAILELHEDATYTLCEYPVDEESWAAVMNLYDRRFRRDKND